MLRVMLSDDIALWNIKKYYFISVAYQQLQAPTVDKQELLPSHLKIWPTHNWFLSTIFVNGQNQPIEILSLRTCCNNGYDWIWSIYYLEWWRNRM
jgi:hypothetical protein